jgi:two-component system, OmpR family, response regulator
VRGIGIRRFHESEIMRLLLVENDPMIGESVAQGLRQDGFTVDWVHDGAAAELALVSASYDLLLLDLGLPKKDGLDVLKSMRRRGSRTPVLVITARDAIADRVKGLDAGADDYLVKPFDLDELAARIRALLRRQSGRSEPVIELGGVTLNPATHEVKAGGQPVTLSAREFSLLQAFLDRPGVVFSRRQLEEKLYGWGEEVESNAVEVHIHALRRKLGHDFIRNIRGVGYMVLRQR